MQKHVTFNSYVEYQPCDINNTTISVADKRIIMLSDKESDLRGRKLKVKINPLAIADEIKLTTSNLLSIHFNKIKQINPSKVYIKDNIINKIVEPIAPIDIDNSNNIQPMEVD